MSGKWAVCCWNTTLSVPWFSTQRNIQGTESATRLPTRTDLVVEARRHGEGRAKARKILEGCHPHANLRRLPPDDGSFRFQPANKARP